MSNNTYSYDYLPQPPRAWSRVDNQCTYESTAPDTIYDPLTKKYVPLAEIYYRAALINKGNVLQYKKNSSQLTKNQRYTQIAKGMWTNRTRTWATQSDVYTNPNTTSLKRVGFVEYPENDISPSSPNNPSGPYFQYFPDSVNCPNLTFKDGGTLICSTYENPCTGKIIEKTFQQNYYPTTDSNVPGPIQYLYWDPRLQTWYPKERKTMNNSSNKWPYNYKFFTSAIKPRPPIINIQTNTTNSITLNWIAIKSNCIPITSFDIFLNNVFIKKIVDTNSISYIIDNLAVGKTYSIFMISVSSSYKSNPSNIISITL
jgi:hypothetical protein